MQLAPVSCNSLRDLLIEKLHTPGAGTSLGDPPKHLLHTPMVSNSLKWTHSIADHMHLQCAKVSMTCQNATPLLSSRAQRKKVQKGWMVPPNSLGQMLNFGTSIKKIQPGLIEKIAFKVTVWFRVIRPSKNVKNLVFNFFHPLNQGKAQNSAKESWSLGINL